MKRKDEIKVIVSEHGFAFKVPKPSSSLEETKVLNSLTLSVSQTLHIPPKCIVLLTPSGEKPSLRYLSTNECEIDNLPSLFLFFSFTDECPEYLLLNLALLEKLVGCDLHNPEPIKKYEEMVYNQENAFIALERSLEFSSKMNESITNFVEDCVHEMNVFERLLNTTLPAQLTEYERELDQINSPFLNTESIRQVRREIRGFLFGLHNLKKEREILNEEEMKKSVSLEKLHSHPASLDPKEFSPIREINRMIIQKNSRLIGGHHRKLFNGMFFRKKYRMLRKKIEKLELLSFLLCEASSQTFQVREGQIEGMGKGWEVIEFEEGPEAKFRMIDQFRTTRHLNRLFRSKIENHFPNIFSPSLLFEPQKFFKIPSIDRVLRNQPITEVEESEGEVQVKSSSSLEQENENLKIDLEKVTSHLENMKKDHLHQQTQFEAETEATRSKHSEEVEKLRNDITQLHSLREKEKDEIKTFRTSRSSQLTEVHGRLTRTMAERTEFERKYRNEETKRKKLEEALGGLASQLQKLRNENERNTMDVRKREEIIKKMKGDLMEKEDFTAKILKSSDQRTREHSSIVKVKDGMILQMRREIESLQESYSDLRTNHEAMMKEKARDGPGQDSQGLREAREEELRRSKEEVKEQTKTIRNLEKQLVQVRNGLKHSKELIEEEKTKLKSYEEETRVSSNRNEMLKKEMKKIQEQMKTQTMNNKDHLREVDLKVKEISRYRNDLKISRNRISELERTIKRIDEESHKNYENLKRENDEKIKSLNEENERLRKKYQKSRFTLDEILEKTRSAQASIKKKFEALRRENEELKTKNIKLRERIRSSNNN